MLLVSFDIKATAAFDSLRLVFENLLFILNNPPTSDRNDLSEYCPRGQGGGKVIHGRECGIGTRGAQPVVLVGIC